MKKKRIQISYLLRPHWKTLTVAFIAVIGESAGDLLEPWPRNVKGALSAPPFKGLIEFSHVDFGYTPDNLILKDVNFKIEPGQLAAFVGPTGAGKTTIASLVARFYDPVKGEVRIDGKDVRAYKIKSVRRQVSFVLQENLLFHASIWQNIAYRHS